MRKVIERDELYRQVCKTSMKELCRNMAYLTMV